MYFVDIYPSHLNQYICEDNMNRIDDRAVRKAMRRRWNAYICQCRRFARAVAKARRAEATGVKNRAGIWGYNDIK